MYGSLDADLGPAGKRHRAEEVIELQREHQWTPVVPVAAALLANAALVLRVGAVVGALGVAYGSLTVALCFVIATLTIGSMAALTSSDAGDTLHREKLVEGLHRALGGRFGQLVGLILFLSCVMGVACSLLSLSELMVHFANSQSMTAAPLPWNKLGSWVVVATASLLLTAVTAATAIVPRLPPRALRWIFAAIVTAMIFIIVYLSVPKSVNSALPMGSAVVSSGWSISHFEENLKPHRSQQFRRMLSTLVATLSGLVGTSSMTYGMISRARRRHSHIGADHTHYLVHQLAVMGILKALAACAVVYLLLVFIVAASAPSSSLLSNPYIILDSMEHVLGVIFVVVGVTLSSLLSAFANITTAASIFTTFFTNQVRWAATLPKSCSSQRPDRLNSSQQLSHPSSRRENAPLESHADRNRGCIGSWVPAVTRLAVMWLMCQTIIFWCGALDPVVPLTTPILLLAFATLNFACFFKEITSSAFHPAFRMYSKWTALIGSTFSLGACFLVVSPVFIVFASLCLAAYVVLYHRELAHFVDDLRTAHKMRTKRRERDLVDERILLEEALTPLGQASESNFMSRASSTLSEDEEMVVEKKRLELAALFVRDANEGRFLGNEYLIDGLNRTHYKRLYHALHYMRMANMSVLIALTFFETPAWCYFSPGCGKSNTQILTWNLPVLPQRVSVTIELTCLGLLAAELSIKYQYMGHRIYFLNKWYIAQIVMLLADCAAVLTVAFVPLYKLSQDAERDSNEDSADYDDVATRPLVLAPLIRPLLLLTMSHRLRAGFSSLLKSLPRFIDGLLTLSILIALYAVLGMMLFEGTREVAVYFSTFIEACTNLIVLLTTANFPDVMMPIYSQSRVASLFFVSFLAIGQLLIMNLVFASVYQHYRKEMSDRAAHFAQRRKQALEAAFHLLPAHRARSISTGTGEAPTFKEKIISRRTYDKLLAELVRPTISLFHEPESPVRSVRERRLSDVGGGRDLVAESRVALYSHWSEEEEENWVTYDEFVGLISDHLARENRSKASLINPQSHVHHSQYRKHRQRQNDVDQSYGTLNFIMQNLSALPAHPYFERSVDVVILVNFAAIIVEIQAKINGQQDLFYSLESWTPVFSLIFVAEMLLKISALGISAYIDRTKNVFDCLVTLVIVAAEVSVHAHSLTSEWHWIRALSNMFATVVRLLPAFTTLYGMLGVVMVMYAVMGMQLFGGKLLVGDPRLTTITYGQSNYYSNNFNDFASALITLFELLIVNNWFVTMDGVVAVTSKWSRLFFISYYVSAVVMVLSLVVAFVVEAYFEVTQTADSKPSSSEGSSSLESSSSSDSLPSSTPPLEHNHGKRLLTQRRTSSNSKPSSQSMRTGRSASLTVEDFL